MGLQQTYWPSTYINNLANFSGNSQEMAIKFRQAKTLKSSISSSECLIKMKRRISQSKLSNTPIATREED